MADVPYNFQKNGTVGITFEIVNIDPRAKKILVINKSANLLEVRLKKGAQLWNAESDATPILGNGGSTTFYNSISFEVNAPQIQLRGGAAGTAYHILATRMR